MNHHLRYTTLIPMAELMMLKMDAVMASPIIKPKKKGIARLYPFAPP